MFIFGIARDGLRFRNVNVRSADRRGRQAPVLRNSVVPQPDSDVNRGEAPPMAKKSKKDKKNKKNKKKK